MTGAADRLVPSQRRLQRAADFTGERLVSCRQIVLRHGLPGVLAALALMLLTPVPSTVWQALAPALQAPLTWVGLLLLSGVAQLAWARWLNGDLLGVDAGWSLYLLALSCWEEVLFRLALPLLLVQAGADPFVSIVLANLLFGAMHWFTLRWRLHWCILAVLGGLALSRHFMLHTDLVALIALHWVGTFLNTPRMPGRVR